MLSYISPCNSRIAALDGRIYSDSGKDAFLIAVIRASHSFVHRWFRPNRRARKRTAVDNRLAASMYLVRSLPSLNSKHTSLSLLQCGFYANEVFGLCKNDANSHGPDCGTRPKAKNRIICFSASVPDWQLYPYSSVYAVLWLLPLPMTERLLFRLVWPPVCRHTNLRHP